MWVIEHPRHGRIIALHSRPSYSWKRPVPAALQFESEAAARQFIANNLHDKDARICEPVEKLGDSHA